VTPIAERRWRSWDWPELRHRSAIPTEQKGVQDFLALRKSADPDIPVLMEAKKEYAALHEP